LSIFGFTGTLVREFGEFHHNGVDHVGCEISDFYKLPQFYERRSGKRAAGAR
jgi:hypothetical protein